MRKTFVAITAFAVVPLGAAGLRLEERVHARRCSCRGPRQRARRGQHGLRASSQPRQEPQTSS